MNQVGIVKPSPKSIRKPSHNSSQAISRIRGPRLGSRLIELLNNGPPSKPSLVSSVDRARGMPKGGINYTGNRRTTGTKGKTQKLLTVGKASMLSDAIALRR